MNTEPPTACHDPYLQQRGEQLQQWREYQQQRREYQQQQCEYLLTLSVCLQSQQLQCQWWQQQGQSNNLSIRCDNSISVCSSSITSPVTPSQH